MKGLWIGAVVLAVPLAWFVVRQQAESSRRSELLEVFDHGDHLERNQRWSEAIEVYRSALALPLDGKERADLRYRLARVRIEGNDLNGALGVLQDLTIEDVARFQIDIGPLYFRLAERARLAGNVQLAMIANRQGTAVSPARVEQFMGQREEIATDAHRAAGPEGDDDDPPPPTDDRSNGDRP
ncbi:MAG: hypothetical protein ACF8XB_03320 [Planctomycetota bacterium JB042]